MSPRAAVQLTTDGTASANQYRTLSLSQDGIELTVSGVRRTSKPRTAGFTVIRR